MTEKEYEQEQETIEKGNAMKAVLDQPVVKEAFERVERNYYAQFKAAKTDNEVRRAHANAKALEDLATELRRVFDQGLMAQGTRNRRESKNR